MTPDDIEFWHWWVLGIVFVVAEVFAPGFILLWLGVAAAIVGFAILLLPDLDWRSQLLIFAVLSVVSVLAWRAYQRRNPTTSDHPSLNRRGEQLIGRRFTLDEPIVNGSGMARIDDTRWKVEGEDLPAGSTVQVIGVEGTVLKVERS